MSQASDPTLKSPSRALSPVQGARIFAALEGAKTAAANTVASQKTASGLIVRQNTEIEAVQDAGQRLAARGRDIRNSLQLLRESVDRAKLTALNAGLEGARLGEGVGKALVVMGDEVRNLLARAGDALEEHTALLAEVERERDRCLVELGQIGDGARELGRALSEAEGQGQLTTALLGELRLDLNEAFGADAETAQLLASSAGQVQALAKSLLALTERTPLAESALRELLEPLLALVPENHPTEAEP